MACSASPSGSACSDAIHIQDRLRSRYSPGATRRPLVLVRCAVAVPARGAVDILQLPDRSIDFNRHLRHLWIGVDAAVGLHRFNLARACGLPRCRRLHRSGTGGQGLAISAIDGDGGDFIGHHRRRGRAAGAACKRHLPFYCHPRIGRHRRRNFDALGKRHRRQFGPDGEAGAMARIQNRYR